MEATETLRESFGRRLRAARERAGFTADSLASTLKVHRNTIYQLERGEQWISSELLEKLTAAFDTSPAVFFTDEIVKIEPTPAQALEILAKAISSKPQAILPESEDFSAEELAMLREAAIAIREARSVRETRNKRDQSG